MSNIKNSFIMETKNIFPLRNGVSITGTIKNGEISQNSTVYVNGLSYVVILTNHSKKMSDSDIELWLKGDKADNLKIGDIVSTNADISLGNIPINIYDNQYCDFCGNKLTKEERIYICNKCGAAFNKREVEG